MTRNGTSNGSTWRGRGAAIVAVAVIGAGCATRVVPPPAVTDPQYPEYVFPAIPPNTAPSADLAREHETAWQWLQAGDPAHAAASFQRILGSEASFYPASVGLGLSELAGGQLAPALERFESIASTAASYAPALAGHGEVLLALGRDGEALDQFELALAADPSLDVARRRIEVLQFRVLQASLSGARRAAEAGRRSEAIAAYRRAIDASPDSGFLHRELGGVLRGDGAMTPALEAFQRAVELDPTDGQAWVGLGETFEALDNLPAALESYQRASALDPLAAERAAALDARLNRARLPTEYGEIARSDQITRGDLAAVLGVTFEALLADLQQASAVVVSDAGAHWAAPFIFSVTRTGVMEVFPNHTFQPRDLVRRGDLARAASRLLDAVGRRRPALADQWARAARRATDVQPGNLSYPAVSLVVAADVMRLLPGDTFQLSRPVSGREALDVVDRIEALLP